MLSVAIMLLAYALYSGHVSVRTGSFQARLYFGIASAIWIVLFLAMLARHGRRWLDFDDRVRRRVCSLLPEWLRDGLSNRVSVTIGFAAIGVCFTAIATRDIAHIPIVVANTGDTLPLIRHAVSSFVHGVNPYREYRVPHEIHLTYLPGLWMTYLPAELLSVDYRWTGVVADLAILAIWWKWSDRILDRLENAPAFLRISFGLESLALAALFFLSAGQRSFIPLMHTPPWWLWTTLFVYWSSVGREKHASLMLGLACASRHTALALLPIWLIYLWRCRRSEFPSHIVRLALPLVVLVLPFYLLNPREFIYGTFDWYRVTSARSWGLLAGSNAETFGVTQVLYGLGFLRASFTVQVLGLFLIFAVSFRRIAAMHDVLPMMSWAMLWFSMTAFVPYPYLYLPVFLLLSVTQLQRWSTIASPDRPLLLVGKMAPVVPFPERRAAAASAGQPRPA